jgi:hypothetical protein
MIHYFLYIDPGSGSYLVQMIVAGVLGVAMFFKNIKLYIKSLFHRSPKKPKDNTPA